MHPGYHVPGGRTSIDDDVEDDLDINLAELDPAPAAHGSLSQAQTRDIPLKNLPWGRQRKYTRHVDLHDDDDDLDALVDHDDQPARSSISSAGPIPLSRTGPRVSRLAKFKARFFQSPSAALDDTQLRQDDRIIHVSQPQPRAFPPNAVSNAKYTSWSFLPRTLYNEFSFFFNLYFLLVALSQIVPALRIGYLSTYIAPLAFVLTITLSKEALDDIARRQRDAEANSERYTVLQSAPSVSSSTKAPRRKRPKRHDPDDVDDVTRDEPSSFEILKASKDLKVGDVLVMRKNQRFPADVILLKSMPVENANSADEHASSQNANKPEDHPHTAAESLDQTKSGGPYPDASGEAFIRTDQLDGETDWKLRLAAPLAQSLSIRHYDRLKLTAGPPHKRVNEFVGTLELLPPSKPAYDPHVSKDSTTEPPATDNTPPPSSTPLTIDNTAWANTVLASSSDLLAVVVYTGGETRAALSTSASRSKTGLLEHEINSLTKILCALTLALSVILVALEGFEAKDGRPWYVAAMRFLILFSTIVPISLRVNLDLGKSVFARFIHRDQGIPGTVVRTSTIPEDLGRIEYLLSDKTGTLTQNEMELKKVHVGTVSYANDAMEEVTSYIRQAFGSSETQRQQVYFTPSGQAYAPAGTRNRREIANRVRDLVLALVLCHNVTPTTDKVGDTVTTSYQASSPDEIAIVQWTESVGLRLLHRDRQTIAVQFTQDDKIVVKVKILNIFPFTSDSKRMGIIVKFMSGPDQDGGDIYFYQKGADTVMTSIVAINDWLDEETANMAREGLRTLVIGRKALSQQQYAAFSSAFAEAALDLRARDTRMATVVKEHLERNLELLGITGVEDKLQANVKPSLELLRNAGVKIWMLTGDKVETARCVAISSKLVTRGQYIHTIAGNKRKETIMDELALLNSRPDACLLIDGTCLATLLTHHRDAFIAIAVHLPAVIACRCSPTQKADVAKLIRSHTKKRTACIGDGGNDVSMIQAADVGVGIVGKEGRQASLAADFSITQFAHLTKLLVWHGRNSYKRSAKLAQFVIHRGLLISVCQTVFSIASHFEPIALYRDWLLVGYATLYTMAPVFSLVLDRDVDEGLANLYPELYKELTSGRSLSYRTFFVWVAISIYQGCVIQGASQLLVPAFYNSSQQHQQTPDAAAAHNDKTGFKRMVSVSFTVLILNELVMVAAEITTWHPVMIFSILGTAALYFGSLPLLGDYYDLPYLITLSFWWRVAAISAASLVPVWAAKLIRRRVKPPSYRKVRGV